MKDDNQGGTIGWKEVVWALLVQTLLGGMAFYSATVRWQAQIEERIFWIKGRQEQNFSEHAVIIQKLDDVSKELQIHEREVSKER